VTDAAAGRSGGPPNAFLEPWYESSAAAVVALKRELERELALNPRHPLYSVKARALAQRGDCDDVLFELAGHAYQLAVVHLTWSQSPETRPAWPATTLFASWADWISAMERDHEGWRP
jgi:hypothetical protein